MKMRTLLLLACTLGVHTQSDNDRLLIAVCGKTAQQLRAIVQSASQSGKVIEVAEDADKEALAAAVYLSAQAEKPSGAASEFPGCSSVPEAAAAASKAEAAASQAPSTTTSAKESWKQMVDMLMKTQDKDKDGKLSREELQKMIDQTNAQAKATGVGGDVDFFTAVDKDGNGFAEYEELEAYFKAQMGNGGYGSGGSAKPAKEGTPPQRVANPSRPKPAAGDAPVEELMFKNLDKNKDGFLSRDEMSAVIAKTNQNAANQAAGESGEDFYKTMDSNGDGSIDREEAKKFFSAMSGFFGKGAPKKEKDEV